MPSLGLKNHQKKRKQGTKCKGVKVKLEDLKACGPSRAVVEMEQLSSGEDLKAGGPGEAVVEMGQQRPGKDIGEKVTSVPKGRNYEMNKQGSFPKCTREKQKVNVWAGRPTNERKENMPEKVQSLLNPTLNPTNNTKLAEMPPKYKNKNVSTRKIVKFDKINLLENNLENRVEIVGDVVVVDKNKEDCDEKSHPIEYKC